MRSLFKFMFSYFTADSPKRYARLLLASYTSESVAEYSTGELMPVDLALLIESSRIESSTCLLCSHIAFCSESMAAVSAIITVSFTVSLA